MYRALAQCSASARWRSGRPVERGNQGVQQGARAEPSSRAGISIRSKDKSLGWKLPVSSANRQNSNRSRKTAKPWPSKRSGLSESRNSPTASAARRLIGSSSRTGCFQSPAMTWSRWFLRGKSFNPKWSPRSASRSCNSTCQKSLTGDAVRRIVAPEPGKTVDRQFVSPSQVLSPALLLDPQRAVPQQIDVAVALVKLLDPLFKAGYLAPLQAKHLEEAVQKALGLAVAALGVLPSAHKVSDAESNLVPAQ